MHIRITIDDGTDSIDIEHVGETRAEGTAGPARPERGAVAPPEQERASGAGESGSPVTSADPLAPPQQFQPRAGSDQSLSAPHPESATVPAEPATADSSTVVPAPPQFQPGR